MLTLISPAKINLFLRILRRRQDNYHDLATILQAVNLYDTLHFSLSNDDELTCNKSEIPTDSSNLILKAAQLFRNKTGLTFGLKAHLEKRIPHEAGLGGGSSNAATTLWALNQLLGQPATQEELITWSGEIGSDITFFLSTGTAFCTGRGEIMQELESLPCQKLWIVKPKVNLSTPTVFKALNLASLRDRDPHSILKAFYQNSPDYFNDLEETAFQLIPSLRTLKAQLLTEGFKHVTMTGTGSSFFCLGSRSHPPHIKDADFHPVTFIQRLSNQWYQS